MQDSLTAIELLLALGCGVVTGYELHLVLAARRKGLTRNVSRLVNHVVVTLLLAAMIGLSVLKWDLQMDRLESTYIGDLSQGRPGD